MGTLIKVIASVFIFIVVVIKRAVSIALGILWIYLIVQVFLYNIFLWLLLVFILGGIANR